MRIKGSFSQNSFSQKVMLFLGISLFSALLFSLIAILVTKGNDANTIATLKTLQFIQAVGLFIIPPFTLAYLWSIKPLSFLQLDKVPCWKDGLFAILIMMLAIPAVNLLAEINHSIPFPEALASLETYLTEMELRAEELTKLFLQADNFGILLINIGLIALIPAIGEELFFRGIIQNLLQTKFRVHTAVWVTAIIFSAFHFQFFGFIPRALMGALLGYLLIWTKNIWIPVIAHFVNNAAAVIYFYFKGDAPVVDLDNIGKADSYYYGVISMVVVGLLIFHYRRRAKFGIS